MLIKTFIPTLVLSLLAPFALAETVAKTYPVKDFTEFVAGGDTTIEITQDGTEYLRVEADAEVMKRVKVDQTGKRVSVWIKSDSNFFNWFGHGEGRVRVVLRVKHLEYLELSGAAHAKVGDLQEDKLEVSNSGAANADFAVLNAANFRLDLSGASNVRINSINSQTQDYDLSGAANVDVKGGSNTQSLKADVSGASNFRAKALTAKIAKVDASGASHIELTVTDELEAGASGASSVNYFGNPKAKTDSSGASHINARSGK
ncbi:GIN domain-containing protein [Cellvibrio mixtus]|uniref:GIN domain-containing protein n=1 Tax=Cellvibrio mixtus TaxID=39650 RepID=UPI000A3EF628|nr:DUF2807 domain-containing protein [Cellvibrio mixtus]